MDPKALVLGAAVAVLAAAPLASVSAHSCDTLTVQNPQTPSNVDTGCNGSTCPADSGTLPHHHKNAVPPMECHNEGAPAPACTGKDHGKKNGHGKGEGGAELASAQDGGALRRLGDEVVVLCHNGGRAAGGSMPAAGCGDASTHVYGLGLSAGSASALLGARSSHGVVTVEDTSVADCNGDGVAGDFDGGYDAGAGGAFFGHGPWANEETCHYGLREHGPHVTVVDLAWGLDVWFIVGTTDASGPVVSLDPADGSTSCSTDGSITPGDPATDPTADADDCLTAAYRGWGANTCGGGGDGGYWVFLYAGYVEEHGGVTLARPPTAGTVTAH